MACDCVESEETRLKGSEPEVTLVVTRFRQVSFFVTLGFITFALSYAKRQAVGYPRPCAVFLPRMCCPLIHYRLYRSVQIVVTRFRLG